MTATTGRTVMLVLLLVAFVAALVFGLSYMQRERSGENKRVEAKAEPKVELKAETKTAPKADIKADVKAEAKAEPTSEAKPAATATPAVSPPGSRPEAESSSAPATAKAEAKAETGAPAQPPRPADTDRSVPSFDITRVERTGDAVIAGRAAPGATVELLRDGESLGRAVADQSGQFVMTPPPLPPGNYELTLRSRLPDGKQAISEQKMVVALDAAESASPAVRSRAEAPRPVTEDNKMASRSAPEAGGPSDARLPSKKRAPSAVVVSRGDSLWRISRATYGSGELYPLLLRANRSRIRDPDLIYPGQSFVLPRRSH